MTRLLKSLVLFLQDLSHQSTPDRPEVPKFPSHLGHMSSPSKIPGRAGAPTEKHPNASSELQPVLRPTHVSMHRTLAPFQMFLHQVSTFAALGL